MIEFKNRQIPETLAEVVDPAHTVVLVHELLNDFSAKGGAWDKAGRRIDATAILPSTIEIIAAARAAGIRVMYIRYTGTSTTPTRQYVKHVDDLGRPREQSRALHGRRHLGAGSSSTKWRRNPTIWCSENTVPDAFYSTHLDDLLRWNGIKSVVLVGNGAEIGLVPTAMHGFNLGYFCVAVKDAVLTADPARMAGALQYIADWGLVATASEVTGVWESHGM